MVLDELDGVVVEDEVVDEELEGVVVDEEVVDDELDGDFTHGVIKLRLSGALALAREHVERPLYELSY